MDSPFFSRDISTDHNHRPLSTHKHRTYTAGHTRYMKPLMPGSGGREEKWLAEVLKANENAKRDAGGGSSSAQLPRSVRNAPPDMRGDIRRIQNRDSARRAREKSKREEEEWAAELTRQSNQLQGLEQRVQGITQVVERREKRKQQAVERRKAAKARGGSSSRKPGRGGSS